MEETEGDPRTPSDAADPHGSAAHPGRRLEPRVGGRVRGAGQDRGADVHRMQGLQFRGREPPPPGGEQRPESRVDPDVRGASRGPPRIWNRRGAGGQSRRPAHPRRPTPSAFPLSELTPAVFITLPGYDAEGRGRPHPDPDRLVQYALDLPAPSLRLRDPRRDPPSNPHRTHPRETPQRPEFWVPPRHRVRDRGGEDPRRVAGLRPGSQHRRTNPQMVGAVASGRVVRGQSGKARSKDGIRGAVPAPQRSPHERHDPDLLVLDLQPGGQGPRAEPVPHRELYRSAEPRGDPWRDLVPREALLPPLTAHILILPGRFARPCSSCPRSSMPRDSWTRPSVAPRRRRRPVPIGWRGHGTSRSPASRSRGRRSIRPSAAL